VVLAAALTGFGVGWLWSAWSGAPAESRAARAPAGNAAAAVPGAEPIVPADGESDEGGAAVTEASSGVDPARGQPPPSPAANDAPVDRAPAEERASPVPGRLLVRSTPAGAAVEIDGRSLGRTPLTVRDLPLGTHTIVVSRPGYERERRSLRLTRERASRSLEIELRESDAVRSRGDAVFTGGMLVESRPRDARVWVDGRDVGRTPLTLSGIRAGSHVVRIELDGYRTWTAAVRVVAGTRRRVSASLEQLP
jgi:hypothetical protein